MKKNKNDWKSLKELKEQKFSFLFPSFNIRFLEKGFFNPFVMKRTKTH